MSAVGSNFTAAPQPTVRYTQRQIEVQFDVGTGPYGEQGAQSFLLPAGEGGHRVSATITVTSAVSPCSMRLSVWGVPLDVQKQLSSLGLAHYRARLNYVTVKAGDPETGLSLVFTGQVTEATTRFDGKDQSLEITALAGYYPRLKPIAPSSYQGTVDVANVMQDLANKMGYRFENNGVSFQISNPYWPGTAFMQVEKCAEAAGIGWVCPDEKGVFAIWPRSGFRAGRMPLISADTGMVGYPEVGQNNCIRVRMLYNPLVDINGLVTIDSIEPNASGTWGVYYMQHELASETPGGPWFTTIEAYPVDRVDGSVAPVTAAPAGSSN